MGNPNYENKDESSVQEAHPSHRLMELQQELQNEQYEKPESEIPPKTDVENMSAGKHNSINDIKRKGILSSVSVRINGSISLMIFVIIIIAGVSLVSLGRMTVFINEATVFVQYSEEMKTRTHEILLDQKEFLQTENTRELTEISRSLVRLREILKKSVKLAQDAELRSGITISSDFADIERFIGDYEDQSKSQSETIIQARKNIKKVIKDETDVKELLLTEIEKNYLLIEQIMDEFWIGIKQKEDSNSIDADTVQKLGEIRAGLLNVRIFVSEFANTQSHIAAENARSMIQMIEDSLADVHSSEKIISGMNQIKLNIRKYKNIFNGSVENIAKANLLKKEMDARIGQQKQNLIEVGNSLLRKLNSVSNRNWVLVDKYKREMEKIRSETVMLMYLVSGIGIITGIFVLIFVPRPVTRGISRLTEGASEIAAGNLINPITSSNTDEIGDLARVMEMMRQNIRYLVKQVANVSISISSIVNELMGTANQQNASIAETSSQVGQISSSVNELSSSLAELNQSLLSVEQFVAASNEKSRESVEQAQIALGGMTNISQANAGASERIQILREKIDEISKVLLVISEVADQTNMLSLNASIEATKAGEAGKGFTVVAGEIRRLADRSLLAAQNINDNVRDIQRAAESAVMSMQKSSEEIRVGSESVNISVSNLKAIDGNVSRISVQTSDMTNVISQQAEVAKVVAGLCNRFLPLLTYPPRQPGRLSRQSEI
ncbi:MAG: methyl-accepting chemotaxis protein [Desulfobacteraceae bacterium]|nr:methyl-accepting chemotaxis protein [Desulfobacteraceae bacterium]